MHARCTCTFSSRLDTHNDFPYYKNSICTSFLVPCEAKLVNCFSERSTFACNVLLSASQIKWFRIRAQLHMFCQNGLLSHLRLLNDKHAAELC